MMPGALPGRLARAASARGVPAASRPRAPAASPAASAVP